MPKIARLFTNGRSQAVRLPREFRFEGAEVFIRRDPDTGDVILSRKADGWREFFDLARSVEEAREFMTDRGGRRPQNRDPLA